MKRSGSTKRRVTRNTGEPSGAPTSSELVLSATFAVIGQMQDAVEAAMRENGMTVEVLAIRLGLTPAMVTYILRSPDAQLVDVVSLGVALGIGFTVTAKRSRA